MLSQGDLENLLNKELFTVDGLDRMRVLVAARGVLVYKVCVFESSERDDRRFSFLSSRRVCVNVSCVEKSFSDGESDLR